MIEMLNGMHLGERVLKLSGYRSYIDSLPYSKVNGASQAGTVSVTIIVEDITESGGMYGSPHMSFYSNGSSLNRIIQHAFPN